MNKSILVEGYCPTQSKQYRISVNYIDAGDCFVKGVASCEYVKNGGVCETKPCPLRDSTPENI